MSFRRILAVLAIAALPPSALANLIVNGSFESPVIGNGSFVVLPAIPGWTSDAGAGIEIQRNIAGSPIDGQQFVELDSHNNSSMFQDVATGAGQGYVLSFLYSPRPNVGAASNVIDVYVDGVLVDSLTGIGAADTVWNTFTYGFTGDGLTRIRFTANGTNDSLGGYLDAVSVVRSVPEPGSLLLAGIAALATFARVRRRAR